MPYLGRGDVRHPVVFEQVDSQCQIFVYLSLVLGHGLYLTLE